MTFLTVVFLYIGGLTAPANVVSLSSPTFPGDISACKRGTALVCDVTFRQGDERVTERVTFSGPFAINGIVEGEADLVRIPVEDRIVPASPRGSFSWIQP